MVFSTARPLEASWLPHQVLCWDLMLSSHFISPTVLWGSNHCPHFPHGETEDWRVESGAQVGGAQVLGRQHSLGWGAPGRPAWWQRASSLICLQNPQKDKTHGLTVMAQARVPRAGPQAALAPARVSEQRHACQSRGTLSHASSLSTPRLHVKRKRTQAHEGSRWGLAW